MKNSPRSLTLSYKVSSRQRNISLKPLVKWETKKKMGIVMVIELEQ